MPYCNRCDDNVPYDNIKNVSIVMEGQYALGYFTCPRCTRPGTFSCNMGLLSSPKSPLQTFVESRTNYRADLVEQWVFGKNHPR